MTNARDSITKMPIHPPMVGTEVTSKQILLNGEDRAFKQGYLQLYIF